MISKDKLLKIRRELVLNQTPTEKEFEKCLSRYNWRRKLQVRMGFYVVDFLFPRKMLIIELDGAYHAARSEYDQRRDAWIEKFGFTVLRFPNDMVWRYPEYILDKINSFPNLPKTDYNKSLASLNQSYEFTIKRKAGE